MSQKCVTCINKETCICDECIFDGNVARKNRYTEATPEWITQYEKEKKRTAEDRRKMAEGLMCQDYLYITFPEDFRETFNKAKLFTKQDPDDIKFMSVWARENALVASNNCMMCELYCSVPFPLLNKYITRVERFGVWIATKNPTTLEPLEIFPKDYDKHFKALFSEVAADINKIAKRVTTLDATVDGNTEVIKLTLGKNVAVNTVIYINPYYYETTLKALGDITYLGYTDDNSPVIFHSKVGRVAIMPIVGRVFSE